MSFQKTHIQTLKDGCQPGHFELPWQSTTHIAGSQNSPADSGSEAFARGDLQSVTVNGSRERRQSKQAEEEERSGGRNERGLNQCHPLQLSAKKDRCSLCLFVCARGCRPARTRINQELFSFKSISALTNLILDQCKMECNTY